MKGYEGWRNFLELRKHEVRRISLPRTSVIGARRKGRGCLEPRPPPCDRLRSDHERENLLAPAKVTLVELELTFGGFVDLPAPLGTTVEIPLVRRRGHCVRGARAAYSGRAVEVSGSGATMGVGKERYPIIGRVINAQ